MKKLILTILLIPICSFAQDEFKFNLFEKTATVVFDSTKAAYALPDSFLIPFSEKIFSDSLLLTPGTDYRVNYVQGKISFRKKFPQGKVLKISYQILPLDLRTKYFHRQPLIFYSEKKIPRPAPIERSKNRKTQFTSSTLKQSGSIVRGISIGTNQGMKLESGLRMQISGKVADKVEVVAALTDQNTPIQPEGNTQSLEEIDKVFVQIKSEQVQATLGDYYLTLPGTEFSPYQRKLQGVMGVAEIGKTKMTISGAVSKGRFMTNRFLGQEGNQGPYQLKGDRGQIDIIVLAGTEKVWIDGELMTRGENRDYVIEYSNGQITFTRNRLITADSRIVVDFQYTDLKFQRGLYSADLKTRAFGDKLDIGVRLLRESDNKENPLNYTLDEETQSRLSAAGDKIDSAYVSGVHAVGSGKGRYVAVDSAGVRFFRYVGADAGDYNLSFTYFGSGKGDYKLVGYIHYKFVGVGQGSYMPVVLLTPAQSHDLLDFSFNFRPSKGINLLTEIAASRKDNNLYSAKDDNDNIGLAGTSILNLSADSLNFLGKNLGKIRLSGKFRQVQERFRYLSRTEEVEKDRKWDVGDATAQAEQITEMNGSYSPVQSMKFSGNWGQNKRADVFLSQRWSAKTELRAKKLPEVRYQIENISSQNNGNGRKGDWVRQTGFSAYQVGKFRATVDYLGEAKKENYCDSLFLGLRYYQIAPKLELINWHKMTVSAELSRRKQDKYSATGFMPESDARTQQVRWEYRGARSFSVSAQYTHRKRTYADSSLGTKLTDLADFRAQIAPFKQALSANWHYQLSNTQVAKQEKIYIQVDPGQGNYRFDDDLNEYIPDALNGDYILRIRPTDEFIPVIELRASSTIKLSPARLMKKKSPKEKFPGWKKFIAPISTETFFQIDEKTQQPNVWAIYRLDLSKFQQEAYTIFGLNNFRQDIFWNRNQAKFSVRLRYNDKSNLSNQYLEGGQKTQINEKSARVKSRLSGKFSAQLDLMQKHEQKLYRIPGRQDKNIFTDDFSIDLSYRPKQRIEIALKSRYAHSQNQAAYAIDVHYYSLAPRLNYAFMRRGRLRTEIEFNRVDSNPADAIIPYEMVSGFRSGNNLRWLASFDYNVSRYMRASVSWNGRYEEYIGRAIFTVRAEMRAYF